MTTTRQALVIDDDDDLRQLLKAVLELNQSLFWVAPASPGGAARYRTDRPAALRWFRSATRANQPHLVPDPGRPARTCADYSWPRRDDWRDDLRACVDRLRDLGLETLLLDQTRPDIGLPVCRVVVPGLCHFWRRFGSRRLWEAPVRLGWLAAPTPEVELNPWCIYF